MSARDFVDSNVLVYAYDSSEPRKQQVAQDALTNGIRAETAYLSVQVMGEFFHAVTRRIRNPMPAAEAREAVSLLSAACTVELDGAMVHRAIDAHCDYGVTYWDGMIIAAAERAGCERILSEDLNEGQRYFGIEIVNPFRATTD